MPQRPSKQAAARCPQPQLEQQLSSQPHEASSQQQLDSSQPQLDSQQPQPRLQPRNMPQRPSKQAAAADCNHSSSSSYLRNRTRLLRSSSSTLRSRSWLRSSRSRRSRRGSPSGDPTRSNRRRNRSLSSSCLRNRRSFFAAARGFLAAARLFTAATAGFTAASAAATEHPVQQATSRKTWARKGDAHHERSQKVPLHRTSSPICGIPPSGICADFRQRAMPPHAELNVRSCRRMLVYSEPISVDRRKGHLKVPGVGIRRDVLGGFQGRASTHQSSQSLARFSPGR